MEHRLLRALKNDQEPSSHQQRWSSKQRNRLHIDEIGGYLSSLVSCISIVTQKLHWPHPQNIFADLPRGPNFHPKKCVPLSRDIGSPRVPNTRTCVRKLHQAKITINHQAWIHLSDWFSSKWLAESRALNATQKSCDKAKGQRIRIVLTEGFLKLEALRSGRSGNSGFKGRLPWEDEHTGKSVLWYQILSD